MTINERIIQLLKNKGLRGSDLCRATGIPQATFSAWKQRGTNPDAKYISAIADFLEVPERYILTGEMPIANNPSAGVIIEPKEPLTRTEERLLAYWKALNDLGQAQLLVDANRMVHDPEYTDENEDL